MKVLVVEDEPIIAFDLENLVLDNGFEIAGLARTRAEALSLAPKADIALVDVQLADGPTGPAIARHLIDIYGIEVIFMTGNPEMVANFVGAVCRSQAAQSRKDRGSAVERTFYLSKQKARSGLLKTFVVVISWSFGAGSLGSSPLLSEPALTAAPVPHPACRFRFRCSSASSKSAFAHRCDLSR